ncbi:NAD(P)/FAD-dependent oxidoreductase [Streptomyces armeniacus]|uniref:NAD(P)/FAD-dependent oxidoreductase n=1 Tax=Streptomyces armeniacus TaxID=83291 RepID=A0A345XT13_9ACTN|nr:FAD-dependent oxidoreductase [Streptomyces armeniacus]AXK34779.1 NAD(P)/FAD-dependent oxidoreductase [Streptomyces armeniacus]
MTSEKRVVVIGGGMAAARFTARLPAADGRFAVTVIGEEPHPAYNRVLLADVLAGRYAPEVTALPEAPHVHRLRGVRAVRVDRGSRTVLCDDGSAVPYDALVLATGSNPVLPPLRGLFGAGPAHRGLPDRELPRGVRAFRTMDDCLALASAVRDGTRAVVIGGGLLGVSAARALALRGARVVLAHQGEHLLDRQLDPGASALLRRHLEDLGVEVHTECRVRGLRTEADTGTRTGTGTGTGTGHRTVRAVEFADGYALGCELAVLACGVRPRTGLARAAGLDVARGVVVDDRLRTSDPRVHAIGDCAEHDGVLYGLAGAAQEQADSLAAVLAAEAAGATGTAGTAETDAPHRTDTAPHRTDTAPPRTDTAPPRYAGTRALTRLTLAANTANTANTDRPEHPLDIAAFGETVPRPDDDVVHLTDATRSVYRKVVVRGDRLVGGILLGDLGSVGALARTWEGDEPLPSAPLLHLLTNDGGH